MISVPKRVIHEGDIVSKRVTLNSCSGYRILGDVICDLDDAYTAEETNKQRLHRKGDSAALKTMINGYESMKSADYSMIVANKCRQYLNGIKTKDKSPIDLETALQCAIALGKRKFAFDVLLDVVERNIIVGV